MMKWKKTLNWNTPHSGSPVITLFISLGVIYKVCIDWRTDDCEMKIICDSVALYLKFVCLVPLFYEIIKKKILTNIYCVIIFVNITIFILSPFHQILVFFILILYTILFDHFSIMCNECTSISLKVHSFYSIEYIHIIR